MGKRSRESLGETPAQTYDGENSKKRRKDGSSADKKNKKAKRLRELRKDIVDLPEEDVEEGVAETVANGDAAHANGEPEVLSKKAEKKRRKKEQAEREANESGQTGAEPAANGEGEQESKPEEVKKSKKSKKEKKKQQKTEEAATTDETKEQKKDSNGDTAKAVADEAEEEEDGKDVKQSKAPRFIVFVGMCILAHPPPPLFSFVTTNPLLPTAGNLPYSATAASIKAHFASLNPAQVRCLTMRDDPTKCRGCAFIDFSSSNDMRTCLDKMHHSTFNDGISKSRKINVELTYVVPSYLYPLSVRESTFCGCTFLVANPPLSPIQRRWWW